MTEEDIETWMAITLWYLDLDSDDMDDFLDGLEEAEESWPVE